MHTMRFFRKRNADLELDSELRFHLDQQIAAHAASGLTPEEARRRALLEFGGVQQTKESVRDIKWFIRFEIFLNDLGFAFRQVNRSSQFFLIAVFTLALGIGPTTIVFSIFYNAFFNAFPYRGIDRMMTLQMNGLTNVGGWKGRSFFSPQEFLAFRDQTHSVEDMTGADTHSIVLNDGQAIHIVQGATVTQNYIEFYGVQPESGRAFMLNDSPPSAWPVFAISHRLWRREFGSSLQTIGRNYLLNGAPHTLVAVMPQGFSPDGADLWIPVSASAPGAPSFSVAMRARPGASLSSVAAELDSIAHRVQKENPSGNYPDQFAIQVELLRDAALGGFKRVLYLLLGAVLLLLLIASSNVANLLLARAAVREGEMCTRIALGAGKYRLFRQLLLESLLLGCVACVAGIACAYWGVRIIPGLVPPTILPGETTLRLNLPVLLAAVCLAFFTAILCGVAPALRLAGSSRAGLTTAAKNVGSSRRQVRLRFAFVVLEVALSFVLLTGSGMLLLSFLKLTRTDFGFDPANILYLRPYLPLPQYISREKQNAFTREFLERIQSLPGVISSSESMLVPPLGWDWSDTVIPGRPHVERWSTKYTICSSGFFETFGLHPLIGRTFSEADVEAERRFAVVNDVFAKTYFPGQLPLGQTLKLQVLDRTFLDVPHDAYFEIIGVVNGIESRDDANLSWESSPQVFIPYSIQGFSHRIFFAKTSHDPHQVLPDIRREMRSLDSSAGDWSSGTIAEDLGDFYRGPRFELLGIGAFSVIGMALAVIGVFGVMAYAMSLQTREFGIRFALGASRFRIFRTALWQGAKPLMAGLVLGIGSSLILFRLLRARIPGLSFLDPLVFVVVFLLLLAAGFLACYLPARRATRVDPVVALRYE